MYILRIIKEIKKSILDKIKQRRLLFSEKVFFATLKGSVIKSVEGAYLNFKNGHQNEKPEIIDFEKMEDIGIKNLFTHYSKKTSKLKLYVLKYSNNEYELVNELGEVLFFGNYKIDFYRTVINDMKEFSVIKIIYSVVNNKKEKLKTISRKDINKFVEIITKETIKQKEELFSKESSIKTNDIQKTE